MKDVIIEVRGGVVQNVAVNEGDVRVVVIDWDNIGCSPKCETQIELLPSQQIRHLAPETQQLIGRLFTT